MFPRFTNALFGDHLPPVGCSVDCTESPLNTSSRCPVAQGLVGPLVVVEMKVTVEASLGLSSVRVGFQVDFLVLHRTSPYFTVLHSRSTNMLSLYRPFPSMLILTLLRSKSPVKPSPVN